jgi:hypothetical protein
MVPKGAVVLALLAAVVGGCTKKATPLSGAVYVAQIPVYPSAVFVDSGGGKYYAEIGGAPTFESRSWSFTIADAPVSVAAFYESRLPEGSRHDDEGEPMFKFTPKGAEEGERVTIRIEPGKLHISELVKPGKRKEA